MKHERRGTMPAIPENLDDYLTEAQQQALVNIKRFGWSLAFVRRLFFQHPLVVVVQANGKRYGVLNEIGTIDLDACVLREEQSVDEQTPLVGVESIRV
ncbi:MAG: hypothetical protein AB7U63_08740 [Porticoccaceae bacterium]